jgi:glycosyltransferase involved in cell wall biosynthesis
MRVIHLLRKFDPAEWGGTEAAVDRLFDSLRQHGVTPVMYCPYLDGDGQRKPRVGNSLKRGDRTGDGAHALTSHSITEASEPAPGSTSAPRWDPGSGTNGDIKRFKTCVPAWGLSPAEKRQLVALGGNLMSFDLLPALWREREAALVHTHTLGRLGGIASMAARMRGLPFVVSIHGGLLDLPPALKSELDETSQAGVEWGKIFGLLLGSRQLIHHADAVFACNQREVELLREKYPGKRIEIQPHGIDLERYREDHRTDAQEAFPQIRGREVLLCVGRIDPVKNQGWLVSQAAEIFRQNPEAMLVLAGACTNESYGQTLQRQVRDLGISGRILVTGGLPPGDPRLVGLFQHSRAVLLPSVSETFGVVLLEAWAAGSVVISSRTSGASALIREGENGWLFDLPEPAAFHEAVNRTLRDEGLRAQLAESGRRLVEKAYDIKSIGGRVKRVYQELIEGKHALRHST